MAANHENWLLRVNVFQKTNQPNIVSTEVFSAAWKTLYKIIVVDSMQVHELELGPLPADQHRVLVSAIVQPHVIS
jgi:hypothetical protein